MFGVLHRMPNVLTMIRKLAHSYKARWATQRMMGDSNPKPSRVAMLSTHVFRTVLRSTAVRCVLLLALTLSSSSAAGQTVGADLSRLSWLAGCWEQRAGTRVIQEQWMAPLGGL